MFELNERTGECTRIDTGFKADPKDDDFIKELEAEGIKLRTIVLEYTVLARVIKLENVSSYKVVSGAAGKLIEIKQFNKEEDGWKENTKYYTTYGLFFVGPFNDKDKSKMSSGLQVTRGMTTEEIARKQIEDMQTFERVQQEMSANNPYGGFAPQPNTKKNITV